MRSRALSLRSIASPVAEVAPVASDEAVTVYLPRRPRWPSEPTIVAEPEPTVVLEPKPGVVIDDAASEELATFELSRAATLAEPATIAHTPCDDDEDSASIVVHVDLSKLSGFAALVCRGNDVIVSDHRSGDAVEPATRACSEPSASVECARSARTDAPTTEGRGSSTRVEESEEIPTVQKTSARSARRGRLLSFALGSVLACTGVLYRHEPVVKRVSAEMIAVAGHAVFHLHTLVK